MFVAVDDTCPDCGMGLDFRRACVPCNYRQCAECGQPTGSWQRPFCSVCALQGRRPTPVTAVVEDAAEDAIPLYRH
jgi:hypothetical protein